MAELVYFIKIKDKNSHYRLAIAENKCLEEIEQSVAEMKKKFKNDQIWMYNFKG